MSAILRISFPLLLPMIIFHDTHSSDDIVIQKQTHGLKMQEEMIVKELEVRERPECIKRICPFIQAPFDDCYCTGLSSVDIERTVYYCGNNYEVCKTYIEKTQSKYQKIAGESMK